MPASGCRSTYRTVRVCGATSPRLVAWNLRAHGWHGRAIDVVLVAQQAVLTRHTAGMTGLAELLLHRGEVGNEDFRIALLIALQIGAVFPEVVTGQASAMLEHTEMGLVDETCEASLFDRD